MRMARMTILASCCRVTVAFGTERPVRVAVYDAELGEGLDLHPVGVRRPHVLEAGRLSVGDPRLKEHDGK